jgi:simple sugar transport system ATP-binding protein
VTGNGQNELLEVISGQRRAEDGIVIIKGKDVTNDSLKEVRALGVGYIPEDRIEKGLLSNRSISENLVLGVHKYPPLANRWFTNLSQIKKYAEKLVDEYNISTPDIEKEAGKLSGGNIQRLILARELSRDPDIILANKPTSGLDISSQEFIRQRLMRERGKGKAILLVSEDLDEVMMMSDRIAVMYEGKIVKVVTTDEVTMDQIGEMMVSGKGG